MSELGACLARVADEPARFARVRGAPGNSLGSPVWQDLDLRRLSEQHGKRRQNEMWSSTRLTPWVGSSRTMFNRLLALFLLGTLVWGVVQWVRHKRLSYLAAAGTSIFLIGSIVTRHPFTYVGALVMMVVRWSLIRKERQVGEAVPDASGLPKLGVQPSKPAATDRLDRALWGAQLRQPTLEVAGAARAVVRGGELEELRAELEQPATALEGWTRLTINTAPAVVPCDGGGRLEIEPGDLNVRARFEHLTTREIDTVRLTLVLADSEGREWELVSYFEGRTFTDDFVDDDRRVALEKENAFNFWSDVPEAWGKALEERCLVAGAGELLDHRFYFDLRIGAQTLTLQMKYQGPKIDLAVLGSELVVRVSDLYQVLVTGEGEERKLDGVAPVPPFGGSPRWTDCSASRSLGATTRRSRKSTKSNRVMASRARRNDSKALGSRSRAWRSSRARAHDAALANVNCELQDRVRLGISLTYAVSGDGIEPPTRGFSVLCSTN